MLKLLSALMAVLLLLVVACGGDDDDSADVDSDEPTPEATEDSGDDEDEDPEDLIPEETEESDDEDASDDDAVSGDHACTYITSAEISEIIGEEVGEGRDYLATAGGATNCTWESEFGAAVFVEVLHEGGPDWYDAIHVADDDPAFEEIEVDGLGDEAIYSDLGVLDVVDGDVFISVQPVLFFSDLDDLEVSKEIAVIVLDRVQ